MSGLLDRKKVRCLTMTTRSAEEVKASCQCQECVECRKTWVVDGEA